MVSYINTTIAILSTTFGITSLNFQLTYVGKRITRKRDRNGNYLLSSHIAPICSAVNDPYAPLPVQFRVGRSKRSKDFFLLESEGLLDTTVKFSIADRKSLGIKNKSRQLSLFYKISKMNLRNTLNNLIANRFKIEADPANSVGLINLKQIYEVSVDGQTFEVVLNQAEILNNVDGQSPNGQNYMRLLMYRIFERFNAIQSSLNPDYRSPVVLNNANIVNSRGLFVERPNLPVF